MVTHDVTAQGVDLGGTPRFAPVLLQMNSEDFPARFLQDLATQSQPAPHDQISAAAVVDLASQPLYAPVTRTLSAALMQVACNSPGRPRLDPTRILSAGLVIRRIQRVNGVDDEGTLEGWMRSPAGRYQWETLTASTEDLDPDPAKRPQIFSGRHELDTQLAAIVRAVSNTETTSPAFAAPPDTGTLLHRTLVYGIVPTASSDVSDAKPGNAVRYTAIDVANDLPSLLQHGTRAAPLPGTIIDYRWMTDEFLNATFPAPAGERDSRVRDFQNFLTALRMLTSVFGAFEPTPEGRAIRAVLNSVNVYNDAKFTQTEPMGDFYARAAAALIDYNPIDGGKEVPSITLPYKWDSLGPTEPTPLATALLAALVPRTQAIVTPVGRYQDATRRYRLRMFLRVKPEHAGCDPMFIWSQYTAPFRIAAWYESGKRAHPPVPLPDPTDRNFLKSLTPNCSFVVPRGLMSAMQGSSLSGLMNGSGGGPALTLDWICGFNIPLITICAFFVLNIFLGLLNIVFFWLPMIKICIPFPKEE